MRAGGGAWVNMDKCENFMFCKPPGFTLHASFGLRVVSDTGTIDVTVERRSLECSCDSFFAQVARTAMLQALMLRTLDRRWTLR